MDVLGINRVLNTMTRGYDSKLVVGDYLALNPAILNRYLKKNQNLVVTSFWCLSMHIFPVGDILVVREAPRGKPVSTVANGVLNQVRR